MLSARGCGSLASAEGERANPWLLLHRDEPDGAIVIFRAESPAPAEAFVKRDPYVTNGLIVAWRIQPWNVVIGGHD